MILRCGSLTAGACSGAALAFIAFTPSFGAPSRLAPHPEQTPAKQPTRSIVSARRWVYTPGLPRGQAGNGARTQNDARPPALFPPVYDVRTLEVVFPDERRGDRRPWPLRVVELPASSFASTMKACKRKQNAAVLPRDWATPKHAMVKPS